MTDIPLQMNNLCYSHICNHRNAESVHSRRGFLEGTRNGCRYRTRAIVLGIGQAPLLIEATAPTINKLSVLLEKYSEVFVNGPGEPLGRICAVEHSIDTGDTQPIKQRPYQIPVHLHQVVDQHL